MSGRGINRYLDRLIVCSGSIYIIFECNFVNFVNFTSLYADRV